MTDNRPRLLMPSAGRKVALVRCLEKHFRVYASGFRPQEGASACLHARGRFVEQPQFEDIKEHGEWLYETCKRIGIDAVICVRDDDAKHLHNCRGYIEAAGAKLIISPEETCQICQDKLAMYNRLKGVAGINVPTTVPLGHWRLEYFGGMSGNWRLPVFAKDRYGAGSRVAEVIHTLDEMGALSMRHSGELVIQPVMEQPEHTVDVFFDADGNIARTSIRQRVTTSEGQMDHGVIVPSDSELLDQVGFVAGAMKFIGPVNMQFMEDSRIGPVLTDINPRFGGGTPLTIAAGADFALGLKQLLAGEKIDIGEAISGSRAISFIDYVYNVPEGDTRA